MQGQLLSGNKKAQPQKEAKFRSPRRSRRGETTLMVQAFFFFFFYTTLESINQPQLQKVTDIRVGGGCSAAPRWSKTKAGASQDQLRRNATALPGKKRAERVTKQMVLHVGMR